MAKRFLLDAQGGVLTYIEAGEREGDVNLITSHDPTPVLENNKRLRNLNDSYSQSREWKRVASIPHGVALELIAKAGISPGAFFQKPQAEQNAFWAKHYMDRDYSQLRTS
jgi:hypothetical protein